MFKFFNNVLILLLFFVSHFIFGMDNNQLVNDFDFSNVTITKPYAPHFCKQRSFAANCLQSSIIGGLSFLVLSSLADDNNLLMSSKTISKAISLGAFFYNEQKKSQLLDSVLMNPVAVLKYINQVRDEFLNELSNESLDEKSEALYSQLKEKYEKYSPIFLLGECIGENNLACVLARNYEPKYRKIFENKVVAALQEKLNASLSRRIQYVSFGAGGKFQDFVILCKALVKNPNASIDIHLIDVGYGVYTGLKDLISCDKNQKVSLNKEIDLKSISSLIVDHARKNWQADASQSDITIENQVLDIYKNIDFSSKQFISYFKKTFPNATLTLRLYSSVDDYLSYIDKKNVFSGDILVTADTADEMSLLNGSYSDYKKLCVHSLRNKPDSVNINLYKHHTQAKLQSISLIENNEEDYSEEISLDGTGEKVRIYFPYSKDITINEISTICAQGFSYFETMKVYSLIRTSFFGLGLSFFLERSKV